MEGSLGRHLVFSMVFIVFRDLIHKLKYRDGVRNRRLFR